jgi:glucose-6-phosphate 1-dehydrogenase
VEASWEVVEPIQQFWNGTKFDYPNYEAGSWGPAEADKMIDRYVRSWRNS